MTKKKKAAARTVDISRHRPRDLDDRDLTNKLSHEATSERQPVAEPFSPVAGGESEAPATKPGEAANPEPLRQAIDEGRTRDKVDYPDPAAAPLGTDAEAGGSSATPSEIEMAEQDEIAVSEPRRSRTPSPAVAVQIAAAALALVVVLAAIAMMG